MNSADFKPLRYPVPPGWTKDDARLAEAQGIDLWLLHDNLQLTPTERVRQHDAAVRSILKVRAGLGIED